MLPRSTVGERAGMRVDSVRCAHQVDSLQVVVVQVSRRRRSISHRLVPFRSPKACVAGHTRRRTSEPADLARPIASPSTTRSKSWLGWSGSGPARIHPRCTVRHGVRGCLCDPFDQFQAFGLQGLFQLLRQVQPARSLSVDVSVFSRSVAGDDADDLAAV